ncbi:MAG TPA: tetratricopeptide repeat protein [Thermoanaerobaculia bacterium]|nr:tetratricopeptide repeat protein [Thermoanaerobaculia bacterium]
MTKDNLLFAILGILLGFISGYLSHEVMASRQPPRLVPGQQAAAGAPNAGTPGMPGSAPGGLPGGPGNPSMLPGGGDGGSPMAEIQRLRQQIEANPNDADAILALANLNFQISSWDRARELYERYLKLRPGDPDILSDLGVTLHNLGRDDDAVAQFHQAQASAPDHWRSVFNEVVVLASAGRFDDAERVLQKLKKMQPDNPDVARLAGEIASRRKAA